jgi:hypothetical protein
MAAKAKARKETSQRWLTGGRPPVVGFRERYECQFLSSVEQACDRFFKRKGIQYDELWHRH